MKKCKWLSLLLAIILSIQLPCAALSQTADTAKNTASSTDNKKNIVLIVLDACRPEYFNYASTPNINMLKNSGTSYDSAWVGHLINNTPPGHATISSGTFPKTHGVVGFNWRDETLGQKVNPTSMQAIQNRELTQILIDSGVPSIAGIYKEMYPGSKAASISAHKYYAATSMALGTADYIVYSDSVKMEKAREKTKEEGYMGPVISKPGTVPGFEPPQALMEDKSLWNTKGKAQMGDNEWAVKCALKLFELEKPEVMLINLPQTDGEGHATGGVNHPEILGKTLEKTDALIGQLIQAYKDAGMFDNTIFIITADHAMIPNKQNISVPTTSVKVPGKKVPVKKPAFAGSPYIWLDNPDEAEAKAEYIASLNTEGIIGTYYKVNEQGNYYYKPSAATEKNVDKTLNDAYVYLGGTFAGPHGPNIILATEEDRAFGKSPANTHGSHGQITWKVQHVPLIISGPGVAKGKVSNAPARLVDIAPTVVQLFGGTPKGMDGIVLSDALTNSSSQLAEVQKAVTDKLTPLRNALRDRSLQNSAKD